MSFTNISRFKSLITVPTICITAYIHILSLSFVPLHIWILSLSKKPSSQARLLLKVLDLHEALLLELKVAVEIIGHAMALAHVRIVPQQLVQAAAKRDHHQAQDADEAEDVGQHATQRDLQRAQVRVDRENEDYFQGAQYVGDGKDRLADQRGVPGVPLLSVVQVSVLLLVDLVAHHQERDDLFLIAHLFQYTINIFKQGEKNLTSFYEDPSHLLA